MQAWHPARLLVRCPWWSVGLAYSVLLVLGRGVWAPRPNLDHWAFGVLFLVDPHL